MAGIADEREKRETDRLKDFTDDILEFLIAAGETPPNEENVFRKMVQKPYFGWVSFRHLSKMSPEDFPEHMDDREKIRWFNNHANKFAKFERDNGRVAGYGVRLRGAKLCMAYLKKKDETKTCTDEGCKCLHVCQKYIGGNCRSAECNFDHAFQSEHNRNILHLLNLDKFADDDIRRIVYQSQPQVCEYYNKEGSTCNYEDGGCNKFHICSDLVRGVCVDIPCPKKLNHRFDTEHSRRLLHIYGLDENFEPTRAVLDQLLIIRHQSHDPPMRRAELNAQRLIEMFRRLAQSGNKKDDLEDDDDDLDDVAAAAAAPVTNDNTFFLDPKFSETINSQTLATWQIEFFGNWTSLNVASSLKIELDYCNPEKEFVTIKMPEEFKEYFPDDNSIKIDLNKLTGEISGQTFKFRRESLEKKDEEAFLWYYLDKNWEPYSEDDQVVIETSFLAKQKRCLVGPNEEYRIKFSDLTQKNRMTGKTREIRRRPIFTA